MLQRKFVHGVDVAVYYSATAMQNTELYRLTNRGAQYILSMACKCAMVKERGAKKGEQGEKETIYLFQSIIGINYKRSF
jgi:hypothetical protein